jgi:4-oxalocrotonate tautomerase
MQESPRLKSWEEVTEISSEVTGIPKEVFAVMIREKGPENVGVGGKLLSERL